MSEQATAQRVPGDLLERAIAEGRRANAHLMNGVRFGLATGGLLLYLVSAFVLDMIELRGTVWIFVLYWLGSGLLWHFARRSASVLELSRFAVALYDMPLATLIQWLNLPFAYKPHALALFTLAVLVFMTVLSSFSMRSRSLFAAASVGTVCMWILALRAELRPVSYFTAPLMLFMTATMMSFMPRRQIRLIRDAAEKQSRRDRLALYFSPGVAEVIEAHETPGAGEACELSVLFCDIRGFTEISEALSPPDVVSMLNDFHGHMVEEVFRFGGTLDKYLGDGLLAYFNAPIRQQDHAERAVRCAVAMIDRLEELNRDRLESGRQPLRVGIGVHAGSAVVGAIGASHRREFTAIGDTVNVGSRLQSLTKEHGVSILASDAIRVAASGAPDLLFRSIGSVRLRGRKGETPVYEPMINS